jgi:hypothetical protein
MSFWLFAFPSWLKIWTCFPVLLAICTSFEKQKYICLLTSKIAAILACTWMSQLQCVAKPHRKDFCSLIQFQAGTDGAKTLFCPIKSWVFSTAPSVWSPAHCSVAGGWS